MSDLAELIFGEKRHFSFRPKKRSTGKLNETRSAPSTPHTVWTIPTNGSVASLNAARRDPTKPVNRAPNPFDYSQSPKSSFDSVRVPHSANQAVPGGPGLGLDKRPSLPGLSDSGSNSSTDSLRPVTPAAASSSAPAASSSPLALASASAPAPAPVSASVSVPASASSRLRPPTSHDPHDSKAHSTSGDPVFTDTLPQRPSTAPVLPVERDREGDRDREKENFSRQPISAENAYLSRRRPSAAAALGPAPGTGMGTGNRHLSPVQEQSEAANATWSGLPNHSNNSSAANLANSNISNSSNSSNSTIQGNTNDGIRIQMSTSTSISTTPSQIDASARERPWDSHVHTIDYDRTMAMAASAGAGPPPYSLEPPSKSFEDSLLRSASPGYAARALPSVPAVSGTPVKSAYPKQIQQIQHAEPPHFSPPTKPLQSVQPAHPAQPIKAPLPIHSVQPTQPIQPMQPIQSKQAMQAMQPMQSMSSIHSMQDDFDFPSPPPADRFNSLPGRRKVDSFGDWSKFWAPRRQTISAPMPQPEYVSFLDLQ